MSDTSQMRLRVRVAGVVSRYQSRVRAWALAITGDFHLAEDVAQEVACIVARRAAELPPAAELAPWLHEVTRRKALEWRRRRQRGGICLSAEALDAVAPHFLAEADEGTAELQSAVAACVDQLPADARRVVRGRYGEGESCEAIAAAVGRSVQGVYALLKRVRIQLGDCVEQRIGRRLGGVA